MGVAPYYMLAWPANGIPTTSRESIRGWDRAARLPHRTQNSGPPARSIFSTQPLWSCWQLYRLSGPSSLVPRGYCVCAGGASQRDGWCCSCCGNESCSPHHSVWRIPRVPTRYFSCSLLSRQYRPSGRALRMPFTRVRILV